MKSRLNIAVLYVEQLRDRVLPPGRKPKGIFVPIRIDVGAGEKAFTRYIDVFMLRAKDGIKMGVHKPAPEHADMSPESLAEWDSIAIASDTNVSELRSVVLGACATLVREYDSTGTMETVPLRVHALLPPLEMPIRNCSVSRDGKKLAVEFFVETREAA